MPSDPLYEKLRFNGFRVAYHSHKSLCIEHADYETPADLKRAGFTEFPSLEEFIENMFTVYGDTVGLVTDKNGKTLFADEAAIKAAYWDVKDFG